MSERFLLNEDVEAPVHDHNSKKLQAERPSEQSISDRDVPSWHWFPLQTSGVFLITDS